MVALLRQPDVRHDALTAGERHLLGPMIKRSDNAAATAVFNRVGEGALYRLARDAGLDHFTTQPTWGLTTITAGSQARVHVPAGALHPEAPPQPTRCTC